MTIRAIETVWKGYRFRSRTEARWAVFFSALGLRWDYEPEGFDLGDAGWYLPDFYLPDLCGGMWAEVKPEGVIEPDHVKRWKALVSQSGRKLLLAAGQPTNRYYLVMWPHEDGGEPFWMTECFNSKYLPPNPHDKSPRLFWGITDAEAEEPDGNADDANCWQAINAARGARFEHGEVPA